MADVLTVKQVAAAMQVRPETVLRWLKSGQLRGFRPGGTRAGWRIPAEELERLKGTSDGVDGP